MHSETGEGHCGWCIEWVERNDEAREGERVMCKAKPIFIPRATQTTDVYEA